MLTEDQQRRPAAAALLRQLRELKLEVRKLRVHAHLTDWMLLVIGVAVLWRVFGGN